MLRTRPLRLLRRLPRAADELPLLDVDADDDCSQQQQEGSHWLLLARQLPMAVWNDAQGGATYSELLSCLFRGFR
ncbi:Os01g0252400 [Oryza sativa Japonica Group]|mgnify:CR=1 FL=1|uniref:Os01g0252400 protein n=1 Tax=Oryza sativa subsp. japonica TaxID=39947 RepID=A0A0P0V0G1_ORYSJ|nr:hypothetical protein EE612_001499 [Oryza sativa]BAS71358.1 Os01g0252400 [Oryza sativa Japonica Group]